MERQICEERALRSANVSRKYDELQLKASQLRQRHRQDRERLDDTGISAKPVVGTLQAAPLRQRSRQDTNRVTGKNKCGGLASDSKFGLSAPSASATSREWNCEVQFG
jgi:hypothetical protein